MNILAGFTFFPKRQTTPEKACMIERRPLEDHRGKMPDAGIDRAASAMQPEALGVVPPLIFTYWTGSPMPALVLACLGLMRKNNPGW